MKVRRSKHRVGTSKVDIEVKIYDRRQSIRKINETLVP